MRCGRDVKTVASLTLFFPMYNERETISRMTSKALDVLETLVTDYEVIIVDDASHDGSERIADELARQHPQVRTVHHHRNLEHPRPFLTWPFHHG